MRVTGDCVIIRVVKRADTKGNLKIQDRDKRSAWLEMKRTTATKAGRVACRIIILTILAFLSDGSGSLRTT